MSKSAWLTLHLFIQTFIFINESLVHGNFCTTDKDCTWGDRRFCCRNERTSTARRRCKRHCIGQYCETNNDCGSRSECCGGLNRCHRCPSGCKTNADCGNGTYCCRRPDVTDRSVCRPYCTGEFCRLDSDCGGRQECCSPLQHCTTYGCRDECLSNRNCPNNTFCCIKSHSFDKNSCRPTCRGESCQSDRDCAEVGLCCGSDHICRANCPREKVRQLGGWIIATIVVCVCLPLLLTGMFAIFFVRRRRLKPPVDNSVVAQLPRLKDPALPGNSKLQNTYRLPPPLPPHKNRNVQLPPDKTHSLKKTPPVPPRLHKNTPSAEKTLHEERRKPPPTPPAVKPKRVQRVPLPGRDNQPPPRPPTLPPRKDQRAKTNSVRSGKVRRAPPLPPGSNPRQCPPVLL